MKKIERVIDVSVGCVLLAWSCWFWSVWLFGTKPPPRSVEVTALGWACYASAREKLFKAEVGAGTIPQTDQTDSRKKIKL